MLLLRIQSIKIQVAVFIISSTCQMKIAIHDFHWTKDTTKNPDIKKVIKELTDLEKSNDHLHELIDNF